MHGQGGSGKVVGPDPLISEGSLFPTKPSGEDIVVMFLNAKSNQWVKILHLLQPILSGAVDSLKWV
jgi:hypothetical protein